MKYRQMKEPYQEFAVSVDDLNKIQLIKKLAKLSKIKAFKRGRKRYHLYFCCTQGKWEKFYDTISPYCHSNLVPCPAGLRNKLSNKKGKCEILSSSRVRSRKRINRKHQKFTCQEVA